MISRIALLSGIVVVAASCADQREATRLVGPEAMISDAVHEGGTSGFFFLPPMVAQPTASGTFDADIATLNPQITICDVTNDLNCGGSSGTLAIFTTTTSPAITVDPAAQQYQVNWDTKGASFVAGKTYRVHVTARVPGARRELGFADVLLTTTPGQAKFLQSGDIIVLPDGRNLPIHVRIETGIPGSLAMSAATASVATGGTDLITAAVSDLHGAPLAGAAVAWSLTTTPATGVADATQPLNPTSGQTGTAGTTATTFRAGTTPGTAAVTGLVAGLSATVIVRVVANQPQIAFQCSAHICLMNADGSGRMELTNLNSTMPAWSPAGGKIAFVSVGGGNPEIYVMNADGSDAAKLPGTVNGDVYPAWSPDGGKIAFSSNRGTGTLVLFMMNVDGTGLVRLTDHRCGDDIMPAWSPDGTRIAFVSDRSDQNSCGGWDIYVMNADGSNVQRLTTYQGQGNGAISPTWSPDGAKIAFMSDRDGNPQLYVMNGDGTAQNRLTNNTADDRDPSWSADGTELAFSSTRDGDYAIYVMNADGSAQRRISPGPDGTAEDQYPRWRP